MGVKKVLFIFSYSHYQLVKCSTFLAKDTKQLSSIHLYICYLYTLLFHNKFLHPQIELLYEKVARIA